jgi:hypothetical protein
MGKILRRGLEEEVKPAPKPGYGLWGFMVSCWQLQKEILGENVEQGPREPGCIRLGLRLPGCQGFRGVVGLACLPCCTLKTLLWILVAACGQSLGQDCVCAGSVRVLCAWSSKELWWPGRQSEGGLSVLVGAGK